MNRKTKTLILAGMCFLVPVGMTSAEEAVSTDVHPVMQSEYQVETRAVNFLVEEKTVMELDGKELSNPMKQGRKTYVYSVPEVKIGRHHVKLIHPLGPIWEGTIMVTDKFPPLETNNFSLLGKLDFAKAMTAEKQTAVPGETKVPPQMGYVLTDHVWWRLCPGSNELPEEEFRNPSGFDVIGVLKVKDTLWYHIDMGYEKCGWVEAKYVRLKWDTLKYTEEEAAACRNGKKVVK